MTVDGLNDSTIASILTTVRSVAVVGASSNPSRPVHGVMHWLIGRGYEVFPINPGLGGTLLDRPVTTCLADLPGPVDMVDVFRNSEAAGAVVDEVLALAWKPTVIWMQLGVVNRDAAERATRAGLTVVMDRCPVIETQRLALS